MLRQDLPPLQKAIVIALATEGRATKNQIRKHLKKDQHAIIGAFKALQKKELIEKVDEKKYHGRMFDLYWLTITGTVYAILFGVSREILKAHISAIIENSKIYINKPSQTEVRFFFDLAEVFPPQRFFALIAFMKDIDEGRITPKTLSFVLSGDEMERYFKVLMRYQETRAAFKKVMRKLPKCLKDLEKS